MLVMNEHGMKDLNKTNSRWAAMPAWLRARWGARRRQYGCLHERGNSFVVAHEGSFCGRLLSGATLRPDRDGNKELYGEKLDNQQILMTTKEPPAAARALIADWTSIRCARTAGVRTWQARKTMACPQLAERPIIHQLNAGIH